MRLNRAGSPICITRGRIGEPHKTEQRLTADVCTRVGRVSSLLRQIAQNQSVSAEMVLRLRASLCDYNQEVGFLFCCAGKRTHNLAHQSTRNRGIEEAEGERDGECNWCTPLCTGVVLRGGREVQNSQSALCLPFSSFSPSVHHPLHSELLHWATVSPYSLFAFSCFHGTRIEDLAELQLRMLDFRASQRFRPLCLGSTSPQQLSTCGIPLGGSLIGLKRGFVRGSGLIRRSSQGGPRADSETEERPIRAKENGRVGGLDELDNQLSSLSSSDNSIPDAKRTNQGNGEAAPREERKRVDWPVFGEGFVLYISMALILLTIVNNVLFKLFIGPPVPSKPPFQETEEMRTEASQRERYKLRSFRDPKYRQKFGPPSVTDVPLS